MGTEQTLASRNNQENVCLDSAKCIDDCSSRGISLQRKLNTTQANSNVMQRKAYVAVKPLDWLSEKVNSMLLNHVPNPAKGLVKQAGKNMGGHLINLAGAVLDDSGHFAKGVGAIADGVSYVIDNVGYAIDYADSAINTMINGAADSLSWPANAIAKTAAIVLINSNDLVLDSAGYVVKEKGRVVKGVGRVVKGFGRVIDAASEKVNFAKDYYDMVDICIPPEDACYETCYSPEMNYKVGNPDEVTDLTAHGLWHKHIVFDPPNQCKQTYDDGSKEVNFNDNEKIDIRGRIERLTGVNPSGPSNIGFKGKNINPTIRWENVKTPEDAIKNITFAGTGELFSEEVLHKNYTEEKCISDSLEQDMNLMTAIEKNSPDKNKNFELYDLLNSNCQHWVDKVRADAKL